MRRRWGVQRTSPEGYVSFGLVAELLQEKEIAADSASPGLPKLVFRGGATMILDRQGNVLYTIFKRINNRERLAEQKSYCEQLLQKAPASPWLHAAVLVEDFPQGLAFIPF